MKTYYGSQTRKALKNFPFSAPAVSRELISALVQIKKAAAAANFLCGKLDRPRKLAITKACEEILSGKFWDQFALSALQGGAGTSINMNVNEVVAARATELLKEKGRNLEVHPLDHVNLSQSTNDVNPSALKLASFRLAKRLLKVLDGAAAIFAKRGREFKGVYKLGRTHLQDAVPTTLGEEFLAYSEILKRNREKIFQVLPYFLELNLGGTAIGNRVNASSRYIGAVYGQLQKNTKLPVRPAKNFMAQTSSQTDFLQLSQVVTLLCVDLSKIANDLRLMASGPKGGLGEISLVELQKGSSIMPGKVNPVLPEAVNQLYFWVAGNNLSLEHAVQASQLELGVMGPTIADSLIMSLKLTAEVLEKFARDCVAKIRANKARCRQLLEGSTAFAALLNPCLGYDRVAGLVEESLKTSKTIREVVLEKKLLTNKEFEKIVSPFKA